MLSGKAYALEPEQDPAAGPPVEAVSNAADTQPVQQNAPAEQKPSNEQPKTAEQPAAPKQEQPVVLAAANEPQVAAGQAPTVEKSQQPKQSEAVEQAPAAEQSQQPKQSEAVGQAPAAEQSQQPKQSEAVEQAPAAEQSQQTIQTVTAEPAVPAAQASQVEQTTTDTEIVQVQPEVTPEQPAAPVSAQPVEQAMTGSAVEDIPVLQAVPAAAPVIFSLKAAPLRTALQNTEGGSGEKGGGGENPAAQTEPLLIIGNKQIELDNDASDATDETAATWSYSSTDGSVTLTGYSGADQLIGTAGKDLTIKASGVNRIGSLVVDGNINIVGSGIILVDSIEFPADSSFSFSTNTSVYPDGYGSAAVFLKQGDGTYMLVNGTVTGVIDDSITIPDGVTLVIPNGSQMLLQSVAKIITTTYEQTDEGTWNHISETSYSLENQNINTVAFSPHTTRSYVDSVVAPELTVPYGSGLIVDTGALMSFNSISTTESHQSSVMHENVYVHQYTPSIALKGLLEVRGRIEKAIIRIAEGAQLEGAENCLNCTINENDNA